MSHAFSAIPLVGCAPSDLLLIDMQLAYASASHPDEIRRKDPALHSPVKTAWADWLAGPIWRHCQGVSEVRFDLELITQCPIPGSYALDFVATVRRLGKPERKFSMNRVRRYDPNQVVECLNGLGWEALANLRYGSAKTPAAVMLFRKRAQ